MSNVQYPRMPPPSQVKIIGHHGSSTALAHARPAFSESCVSSRRGARLGLRRASPAGFGMGSEAMLFWREPGICMAGTPSRSTGAAVDRRKPHGETGTESTFDGAKDGATECEVVYNSQNPPISYGYVRVLEV